MTTPCEVCEMRFVGCHAKCDVFLAWNAQRMEERRDRIQKLNREDLLNDFRKDAIRKTRRRRR